MDVYFYMECLNMITNLVISGNLFSNMLEFKYNKFLCNAIFFVICILDYLINMIIIQIFDMSLFQANIYKFVSVSIVYIPSLYFLSDCKLKKVILAYIYYLIMGYSVDVIATIFASPTTLSYLTIFIEDSFRMIMAVMGNVLACVFSMVYLLIFFKKKNNIKDNYMFLVLILPAIQFFVLDRYIVFLEKDITIEFLVIGTLFFISQIFINIIVMNLVMKSILSHDLKKKIYIADLENEKSSYVRDLYKTQKIYFKDLLNNFRFPLNGILDTSFSVKKNRFDEKNIFQQGIGYIIDQASELNNMIITLLDNSKNSS